MPRAEAAGFGCLKARRVAAALAAACLSAFGVLAVSPARSTGGDDRCRPEGARLLAASGVVEAYWPRRGRALYACRRGTRGRVRMSPVGASTYPAPAVAVRGHMVGYAFELEDGGEVFRRIFVQDVRRPGNRRLILPTYGYVGNLKLGPDGSVIWMACAGGTNTADPRPRCRYDPEGAVAVYKHDGSTPQDDAVRLDEGVGVNVRSLRVRGRVASWRHDGEVRSTELQPGSASGPSAAIAGGTAFPAACRPSGASLRASNGNVRVYRRDVRLLACLRGRRRGVDLYPGDTGAYPTVRLRGWLAAFGAEDEQGLDRIVVTDVRRPAHPRALLPAGGGVADLVFRSARRLAWTACAGGSGPFVPRFRCRAEPDSLVYVYRHDRQSRPGVPDRLDVGTQIGAASLRLWPSGRAVAWRNGDRTRRKLLR